MDPRAAVTNFLRPAGGAALRAADADREHTVRVLADAVADGRLTQPEHLARVEAALRAATLGELNALTADLLPADAQPNRLGGVRAATALFKDAVRDGRWVLPDSFTAVAVGASLTLDIRHALLTHRHSVIDATAVFGRIKLLVPEGVTVVVSGGGLINRRGAETVADRGAAGPLIDVRAWTALGSVQAIRPDRPRRWRVRRA